MSAHEPPAAEPAGAAAHGDESPLPRFMRFVAIPAVAAPLLIFGFVLYAQRMHDEARCPFHELARRPLASEIVLLEEARQCLRGIEEHRYSVLRGEERRLLGERRFDSKAFARGAYRVDAQLKAGEVQLIVHNDGHDDVLFREGTQREHERGISLGHRAARDEQAR